MDLLPSDVRAAFARYPLGSQESLGDNARVLVKYFFPAGRYTFFVTEAQRDEDDWLLFGYCVSPLGPDCDEWGYASLAELSSIFVRGLAMERDIHVSIAAHTVRDLVASAA